MKESPHLQSVTDRVDFNAITHDQLDLDGDRLSNLVDALGAKRLGRDDVEADIIAKTQELLVKRAGWRPTLKAKVAMEVLTRPPDTSMGHNPIAQTTARAHRM